MDGPFYLDLREPHFALDAAQVTLGAANKAVVPVAAYPPLGSSYFNRVGKQIKIRMFGRMTCTASAGTLTVSCLYGTGADANGVSLAASASTALVNSATNISWMLELFIHTRSLGAAGTLFCTGRFMCPVGLILSTAQPMLIPASAPAPSAACDLTANLVPSVQMLCGTSTTNTVTVHDMDFIAEN